MNIFTWHSGLGNTVPIKRNLTDLLKKIKGTKENDEEAKKIAKERRVLGCATTAQALWLLSQSPTATCQVPVQPTWGGTGMVS